jgi:hypothetical protein
MTKKSEHLAKLEEHKARLRELVKPGDTVYTVLRHVSRSGMYRAIDLYLLKDNDRVWLSAMAAPLLEGFDQRHEACKASGCGMDMGFHLVHNLASALYPAWECTGEHCPSNDHVNAGRHCTCGHDWSFHQFRSNEHNTHCKEDGCKCRKFITHDPRGAGVMHGGGYALRQAWL